ncbi:Ran-binding protein 9 [Branchiostoma belcheri]|nr:Ran-binding protein 9 [Branchiostoma belcheri]
MQQGPRQSSFELGEGPRLRHTRLKFVPLFDGTREEQEPVKVVPTRDGLQLKSVVGAAGASSRRDNSRWNKSPNPGELINTKSNPSTSANQDHVSVAEMNAVNSVTNGFSSNQVDVEMEVEEYSNSQMVCNGVSSRVNDGASTSYMNGCSHNQHREDLMETDDFDTDKDVQSQRRQLCGGSQAAIEKMLQFGRELQGMSVQLRRQYGKNEANKKVLQDAFSLLAYADPWNSPVGYQLDTVQREPICAALNSAILESHGLPRQPPLEKAVGHATECLKLMSKVGIGSCAFANIEDYLR